MPITGFKCPTTFETIPIDKAPEYFEENGIIPGDVIQAMAQELQANRGASLSPSIMDPDTTCRRKIILQRFMDYSLDPLRTWEAMEGTMFHQQMATLGRMPQWHHELHFDAVEVFPEIYISGTIDRVSDSFKVIVDHKTKRYASKDYDASMVQSATIQVNLYRYAIEVLKNVGVKEMWIWRTFRGSYDRQRTFRKLPVPFVERGLLWNRIKEHVLTLREWMLRANEGPEQALKVLESVPLDGRVKQMFNGQMCSKYCEVNDLCFQLAGIPSF